MLKSLLRRAVAALGISLLSLGSAANAATPATQIAHPALWAVSDADTTVRHFTRELRWNQAYHRLAQGF